MLDWRKIPGFGEHDFEGFYEKLVQEAPPDATLVEVGCYYGRSLVQLGYLAKAADKGLRIHGVDWGEGMGGGETRGALVGNVFQAELTDIVQLTFFPSPGAAARFADNSCWLVFLDAAHTPHEAVADDVLGWMPKVAPGGWLAGHDYRWHTVVEPAHALLRGVEHDPQWDNCWRARKQVPQSGSHVNIHKPTMIPQSLDPDYAD